MSWFAIRKDGLLLRFHAQPKAARSEITGLFGEGKEQRLKIRIQAPPVDGEANEELRRFLRKLCKLPLSRIELLRGEKSREKDILLAGMQEEESLALVERLKPR